MSQNGLCDGFHIVIRNMITPVHNRTRFRSQDKILRSPGPSSPINPILNKLRHTGGIGAGAPTQRNSIIDNRLRNRDPPHNLLQPKDFFARDHVLQFWLISGSGGHDDLLFIDGMSAETLAAGLTMPIRFSRYFSDALELGVAA